MAKSNGKAGATRIDKLVGLYVRLRNEVDKIKDEQVKVLEPYEREKEELIARMLRFLDDTGQDSAKTAEGTVRSTIKYSASVPDKEAFMDFVRQNDLYELMDRRANALACKDFAKEHGALPPGVKLSSHRSIGVTKS